MNTVVILGSTGMIGSGVTKFLSEKSSKIIEVNREGVQTHPGNLVLQFDVVNNHLNDLFERIPTNSVIVNLIGVIRHKIIESELESVRGAKKINSEFPLALIETAEKRDCKVIQIGTDCVFSGSTGSYFEDSIMDPIDLYGETKVRGETKSPNLMTLRVSVIGKERTGHIELMDWVLRKNQKEELLGYTNHLWNGVTSLHLGKIIFGLLNAEYFRAGTFHIVPADKLSKFELISSIAAKGGRTDLRIAKFVELAAINRTLATQFPEFNSTLWNMAGYPELPTINLMLDEYFNWDSTLV